MRLLKKGLRVAKSAKMQLAGVLFLIFLAVFLLWFNNANSMQAEPALVAQVYFDGEYRITNGEWQSIVRGEHIPSTKGDVTLRGNFHVLTPDGEYAGLYEGEIPIAFYTDHIGLTFYEVGSDPYIIDMENPLYGSSACGEGWTAYSLTSGSEGPIEILIHNPHAFGNETAIDEMLSKIALWTGIDFEAGALNSGEPQRNAGMLLMLVSLVFLGIALFSSLIHVKSNRIIWLLGLVVLFAGVYFLYSAEGISFWSASIVSNTTVLGASMMFYMLFLSMIVTCLLKATKRIGNGTVVFLSVTNAAFFLLPIVSNVFFYDTWVFWIAAQTVANVLFTACLIKEAVAATEKKERWLCVSATLPMVSFFVDVFGTWSGFWKGGLVSRYVFIALFAVATVMVLKLIPQNINAATKARELELEKITLNAQLAESRISTMMSQGGYL